MSAVPDRRSRDAYRLVWRWHFYAGLFCLPFVLWLACTGSIYLFKPQIEAWLDRPYDRIDAQAPRVAPSMQVAAALAVVPGGVLNAYELPASHTSSARVLVGRGDDLVRVYVDPTNGHVLHQVVEDERLMRRIFYLHGELLLGDRGSMLVELAASWAIVMILSGLYLWWPRDKGLAGVLYPRVRQRGRLFWRDLHAVAGVWVALLALTLLTSGLPWAKSWGGMLKEVRQFGSTTQVDQDWNTGRSDELAKRRAANTAMDDMADMPGMNRGQDQSTKKILHAAVDLHALDRLVPTVAGLQLPPPVLIAPPSKADAGWTGRSDTQNRPKRLTLKLDGATGQVINRKDFAQGAFLDRAIGYGVAAHEGQLFGWPNQLLGLTTALGLITVTVSGFVMWWRRKPVKRLGAPPAHGARYPRLMVGLLVVFGVLLPLLGISMLLVLTVERLVLRRVPRLHAFFN
ncbi:MAG TPA: PepSY domain-containing protein [Pinirhizobacter sp.]|uniref:PepSY-associated TM helix domain-containing protein n=1 Tax=Pinirhizobacter sp. TaxID=2950432 RepID=UPI002CC4132A|nr:PepSY domain-containing protein [Pinirhizobacter sp.]HMH68959.1 PepSY domain-containing protein [Pinirhizobacter sp.]